VTFPAILSEVLPERLSPGRGLFIPLSRDVFKMEKVPGASTREAETAPHVTLFQPPPCDDHPR